MLATQLAFSSAMVVGTIVVHLVGLLLLLKVIDHEAIPTKGRAAIAGDVMRVIAAALGLFALHTVEIWAYAFAYLRLGALDQFESALYFSTVTYVAIGYGDVLVDPAWRVSGAIEGANGIILLGWSTAFLVSVVSKLRVLERRWEDPLEPAGPPGTQASVASVGKERRT
ncbi:potassium channel family protein [Sphingomonas sp. NPDC079357]|uniref:potassium channel family protein n=1 Tax=Sphingomonas sp. NPDC079357 TaxID=3364518 RepID=UPI00384D3502